MKKIFYTIIALCGILAARGQNVLTGIEGVYGVQNDRPTTMANGGGIVVYSGGNWVFAGNVTSADKGNPNSPNATGRAETIAFNGTATYTGAPASGFVDGYVAVDSEAAPFIVPVGTTSPSSFYAPVTVPGNGVPSYWGYFSGPGSSSSITAGGLAVTMFSPYYDMATNTSTGSYTFTYPAGFINKGINYLLDSIDGGGSWAVLATLPAYSAAGGTVTVSVAIPGGGYKLAFGTVAHIVATPDTGSAPSSGGIAVANVAANDSVNGAPATIGTGGNATISQSGTWPSGITLNDTTGAISVASDVLAPGTYIVAYQLCDTLAAGTCVTASDTVKVLAVPDITPTIDIDNENFTSGGTGNDFVVNMFNVGAGATTSPIIFRISKISGFNITFSTASGTSNVFGGEPNNNSDWTFTQNASFITVTSKTPAVGSIPIPANGASLIGFTITPKSGISSNLSQNITVTVAPNSGGETNSANDSWVSPVTIN